MLTPDAIYEISSYFVDNQSTVRKTAQHFGVSKSTVYLCVSKYISRIHKHLSVECTKLLARNKAERAYRGGYATKRMYASKRGR